MHINEYYIIHFLPHFHLVKNIVVNNSCEQFEYNNGCLVKIMVPLIEKGKKKTLFNIKIYNECYQKEEKYSYILCFAKVKVHKKQFCSKKKRKKLSEGIRLEKK